MAVDWDKVEFKGEKRFLSNMYACKIVYKGKEYGSSEHIYQAMKSENAEYQEYIRTLEEPKKTKKEADRLLGDSYKTRADWDEVKLGLMEEILYLKFTQNSDLKERLLEQKGLIEEKNSWGDRFWGTSDGVGENHLGKLLMKTRDALQELKIDNNIHLEKLELSHTQRIFELTEKNRALFRQWLIWVDGVKHIEDTKAFIHSNLEKNFKKKTLNCAIFYDNELVGTIELIIQKGYGITKGELGYWLDRDFHGKGILHKSAKKMIEIGFSDYNLDKIIIRCAVRNERSCNVAQKLGFSHEGRQREEIKANGIVMDVNMFALLRREYDLVGVTVSHA